MKKYLLIVTVLCISFFAGCKKSDTSDTPPTAEFAIKNANAEVNEGAAMTVSNNSSSCRSASYLWDFGNGKTSVEKNPAISYGMHGQYTVKLTITDDKGRSSTTAKTITVLCVFASPNHPALF